MNRAEAPRWMQDAWAGHPQMRPEYDRCPCCGQPQPPLSFRFPISGDTKERPMPSRYSHRFMEDHWPR